MTSQDGLGDRYGAPAPWRRWTAIVASAVLALAFLGWLGWTAWVHATPDVDSELVTFEVQDEHAVIAEVDVHLKDAGVRASCLVRAFAEDHTVVGELSFVPEYGADQPIELSVRTERRATSVELIGCTAPGEPRPR
ncbi:MAG: hypothetical protein JWO76_2056 [Nocardioides sp.]|nr:hypothetical protein [Nocardioides sp.]